jgi:hypothetical protein
VTAAFFGLAFTAALKLLGADLLIIENGIPAGRRDQPSAAGPVVL